ncbi:FHA domain-containing protein [Pseudofulvimonas gallinarii]|uniref:FHA domain-containing protein n=1 Tax=Pseudofulvimonas gallinarii TaxID=634155 RepID=UPI0014044FA8|nr:FHA domain-containing protein [Pseudofulvimonas gallinarii]
MTLTLVDGDQPPLLLDRGEIRVGSHPENELAVPGSELRPVHARISVNQDGALLRLVQADAGAFVSRRPVQSLAFLHDGDLIEFGKVAIRVEIAYPGREGSGNPETMATRVRRVPPRYVLRGVTGSQFGRLIPIYGRLLIGRDASCDLVLDEPGMSRRHAAIESHTSGLVLRDLDSANGVQLNGSNVNNSAPLKHGDQIVVEGVRFLVQAIDQIDAPLGSGDAAGLPAAGRGEGRGMLVWWAAAVVVLAIAAAAAFMLQGS